MQIFPRCCTIYPGIWHVLPCSFDTANQGFPFPRLCKRWIVFRRHLTYCYASYILNDFTRGVKRDYSLLRGCITGNFILVWLFRLKATRPAPASIPKFLYVGYPVTSGPRWLQFELPSDIKALAVGSDGFTWKVVILEAYNDLDIQWLKRK